MILGSWTPLTCKLDCPDWVDIFGRNDAYENLFIRTQDYYREKAVSGLFTTAVVQVDHARRKVILDNGGKLAYDNLLIASGARPVKPPVENLGGPGVFHLWTLQDALDIKSENELTV